MVKTINRLRGDRFNKIVELASSGKTIHEIADITGMTSRTVSVYLSRARRDGYEIRNYHHKEYVITVPTEIGQRFDLEAGARLTTGNELMLKVLQTVASDNLINAVLDDG